jgi:hypothetical protein
VRRDTLIQNVIALERSPTEAAAPATDSQLQESMDSPDCSDTMLKFYDWDKMKYLYENCGLTIANPLLPSTFIVKDHESK